MIKFRQQTYQMYRQIIYITNMPVGQTPGYYIGLMAG